MLIRIATPISEVVVEYAIKPGAAAVQVTATGTDYFVFNSLKSGVKKQPNEDIEREREGGEREGEREREREREREIETDR